MLWDLKLNWYPTIKTKAMQNYTLHEYGTMILAFLNTFIFTEVVRQNVLKMR